ncbi:MAG: WG repeat-containing protein [Acutalibacteraceae bacterium]
MKKNNNRLYVMLAIIALVGLSWYQLINSSVSLQEEYDGYLATARSQDDKGVRTDALEAYNMAMGMADSIELREEVADFYRRNFNEAQWEEFCKETKDTYPKEAKSYEILMNLYKETGDYAMLFSTYEEAKKKQLLTDTIKTVYNNSYYDYEITNAEYEDIGGFTNNMCPIKKKEKWGIVSSSGTVIIPTEYEKVSGFTSSGFAAALSEENGYVILNEENEIKYADEQKRNITDMGFLSQDKIAAQINGKYCYMNVDFKNEFGSYDYATTYYGGIAAVKNSDKWMIVNEAGEQVGSESFDDIKLDKTLVAFRNGVAFAQKNGKYYLINTQGDVICDTAFEDAEAFASEGYAAAKYNGSWGFVDTTGKFVINPQYMYAHSFTNDLAAVSNGEEWVYINTNNDIVIEGKKGDEESNLVFEEARQFSDNGAAFVKINGYWSLLKIYRQTYA